MNSEPCQVSSSTINHHHMRRAAGLLRSAPMAAAAAAASLLVAHHSPALAELSSRAAADTPAAAGTSSVDFAPPPARPLPPRLQEGRHFLVLTGDGDRARLSGLAAAAADADVVLLGEFHDDPVAHVLQLELLRRITRSLCNQQAQPQAEASEQPQQTPSQQQQQQQQPTASEQQLPAQQSRQQHSAPALRRRVVLSLEIFERDVQPVLDEWLAGSIRLADLVKDGRAWKNFSTDYLPLLEHARQLQLPVLAANAPRRYVSLVGRSSQAALQQLPAAARSWLPPLPYPGPSAALARKVQHSMRGAAQEMQRLKHQQQPQQQSQQAAAVAQPAGSGNAAAAGNHKQQQESGVQHQQSQQQSPTPADGPALADGCPYVGFSVSSNFMAAQALWDASMAHAIAGALDGDGSDGSSERPLVVHVCGKFHCEHGLGIPEQLPGYVSRPCNVLVVVFVPAALGSEADEPRDALREAGLLGGADFVVLTDGSLPRSFDSQHPV